VMWAYRGSQDRRGGQPGHRFRRTASRDQLLVRGPQASGQGLCGLGPGEESAMPIVGEGDKGAQRHLLPQADRNAEAAGDDGCGVGVTDREHIAIGGLLRGVH